MEQQQSEYYSQREREERAAAKAARCPAAMRAHEQLAESYASLAQRSNGAPIPSPDGLGRQHLIILSRD